ncbi:hypothetical protein [Burkholderia sp. CCA53]|uniref:hypothetical protein n=1 Tax=Burkholderia sp. CCA53 TaxID=1776288 RepID=UPI0020C783B5|nr:hypothetical protein [Burkholderia sp. CCA53]
MLTGQTQPLSIAAKSSSRRRFRPSGVHPRITCRAGRSSTAGRSTSPEKLRSLEAQGEVILLGRLLEQQTIEHQVLSRSIDQKQNGLTEHEILVSNEIIPSCNARRLQHHRRGPARGGRRQGEISGQHRCIEAAPAAS